jgi:hypothetical protein
MPRAASHTHGRGQAYRVVDCCSDATVQPLHPLGLDIPGSFPTMLAELQPTHAAQQAQAALSLTSWKGAHATQIAS